jgi:hypothetical protein
MFRGSFSVPGASCTSESGGIFSVKKLIPVVLAGALATGLLVGLVAASGASAGTAGSLDPAFDFSGATGLDQARDGAGAVAAAPNGQIVAGGGHFLSSELIGVARVNADGSLDQAFGSGGTVLTTLQGNESPSVVLIQPDGKILAVGSSENNATGISDIAIVRYLGS